MKIYVDNFESEVDFAEKIIKRLNSISHKVTILNYQIISKGKDIKDDLIADAFDDVDIIIPVVTSDYLSKQESVINNKLDLLADENDKYIIPIIYSPTKWSSKSWIVKSKIFPQEGDSIIDLTETQRESTLNRLVQTIEDIIVNNSSTVENSNSIITSFITPKNSVFISHSHEDADFAELSTLQLDKNGINGWMDAEKLKVGQDWRQDIDDAISNSIALIVIMSPDAKKSEYVTYEWSFAWGKGIKIIPVMLKQTTLHPRLESLQYLDFTNRNTRSWDKIIESIKSLY